jgi:integrase
MTITTLNRNLIASLPKDVEGYWWDDSLTGFGFIQRFSKRRNAMQRYFVAQYKFSGRQRKIRIGDLAKLSVDQARRIALKHFGTILNGTDPQAVKEAERAELARPTLEAAVQKYLDAQRDRVRPKSLVAMTAYLSGDRYFPNLHRLLLHTVTRDHIAPSLVRIAENSGTSSSGRARAILSSFFAWCMVQGLCASNPVLQTEAVEGNDSRERVLTNAELAAIWNACDGNDDYSKIIRLLILSGTRRQEIGGLKWSELDLDAGTLTVAAERSKNGRKHILTLPEAALKIIRAVEQVPGRDYLFGDHAEGFRIWPHAKAKLDAKLGAMAAFTVHDIRRTFATGMADVIKVAPHVVEAMLNHVAKKTRVQQTYNRATYADERKEALELWAAHVEALASGKTNVVPLRRVG